MELAAFSDRGIGTRERLEDYAADRIVTTAGGLQLQIAMVCDGAGGGEAGELAARLTSRTIFEYLEISPETSVPKLLIKAVEQANKTVYSELHGTGTSTVSLAAVHLNDGSPYGRLYIANVGNSRIYLMRAGRIARLNIDHTLANEYVFAGQMSFEEANQLNDPEYVTRAIGIGTKVSVDIGFYVERGKDFVNSRRASRIGQKGMELQEGDTVFAASDGLFPSVHEDEFLNHALDDNVERATRTLLKYAGDRGTEDNIALSMLFVPSRSRKMVQTGPRLSSRQRAGIGVFLVAVLLLVGFLGLQVASGEQQRVAILATQTFAQQFILQLSYTPTSTPLPPTMTPTEPFVTGQVGNRFSLSLAGMPVFTGRYIDPLKPDEINYVSVSGQTGQGGSNPANLFLQPGSSIRLNQIVDTPNSQHIDMILGRGSDLFANAGDFQRGGISVALQQNPDIVIQSQNACLSIQQISADPSKQDDTDKAALVCYGGGTCTYQFPGGSPESITPNQQVLLDVDNQKLLSSGSLTQDDINKYRDTIWQLTHSESQLSCLSNWLDEDLDGVKYPADLCPADYGQAFNNGCPVDKDLDGDNLVGINDRCPLDKGPASNQGCPTEGLVATQYAMTQTAVAQVPTPTLIPPTATPTAIPPPELINHAYTTLEDTPLDIAAPGVLAGAILHDGDELVTLSSQPTSKGGTVSLNSNGSFHYVPPAKFVSLDESGSVNLDSFEYKVTGPNGDTTAQVTIKVTAPPPEPVFASFTVSPSSGDAPLTVLITDTSSGPVNSWEWDFGDGSAHSFSPTPGKHTYKNTTNSTVTYIITLTVTGPDGKTDSATRDVTVKIPQPVACFTPKSVTIQANGTVNFDSSCSTGSITTYSWNFGDNSGNNTSSLANPSHTYQTASSSNGFTVTLTVSGPGGTSSTSGIVKVTPPAPTACFTPTSANLIAGDTVAFVNCSTGSITTYSWNFGDGGTSTQANPSHPFNTPGDYSVTLVVTGPGGTNQITHSVFHVANQIGACFNVSPASPIASGTPVTFTNCTVVPNGVTATYQWDFDDGGGTVDATTTNAGTTYTAPGPASVTHTVTLTVLVGGNPVASTTRTFSIYPVPAAPTAGNDQYAVNKGGTLTTTAGNSVLVNDTPAGLTISGHTDPTHGVLNPFTNSTGTFTYKPNPTFAGLDTFTYTVTNVKGTATATVSICVNPVPINDSYYTANGTTLTVGAATGVLANDTSAVGLSVTPVLNPANASLTLNANGSFTYNPPGGSNNRQNTFTYELVQTFTVGTLTITCTSPTATITIATGTATSPPVAIADTYTLSGAPPLNVAAPGVLTNDTDSNTPAALAAVPIAAGATTGGGTVTLLANGSFTYTPQGGFTGTDTFQYKAVDNGVQSVSFATVTIYVGVSPPPVANNDFYSTPQNTALNIPPAGVLANDTDTNGLSLTAAVVATPTNGTLTLNANGSFTYTPNGGFNGSDSFTYNASNGTSTSNTATVTIGVGSIIAADHTYSTPQNTALTVPTATGLLANAINPSGNPLTAFLVGSPFAGTLTLNADGSFTYTPVGGFSGQDFFFYQISDGISFSNVALGTINVGLVGQPVAVADTYTTQLNTTLNVPPTGVLANDSDPGGNPLSAYIFTFPANGTVFMNTDGSFSYTPPNSFTGTDSFTYYNWNGFAISNTVSVTICIEATAGAGCANTPPVAVNDSYNTAVNTPLTVNFPGILANDTDPDGNPLTVSVGSPITGPNLNPANAGGNGTLTLDANGDGGFTYTPPPGYVGTVTFTYNANDGTIDSAVPATVTIGVGATVVKTVAIKVPAPPPATLCTNTNFENPGMIRSHFTNDIDRDRLYCRLIAANGSYMFWFGSPITNAGNVGAQNVLDLGLVAAVDVFSLRDVTGFVGDVDICLKGAGYIIYMNVLGQPRVPQLWSAWTTDAFPGYTCTTLYAPGTVVLVANKP
jgi:PKD repeat protein/serine/threonine protein phosphatase PrpC